MSEGREKIVLPDRKIYLGYLRVLAIFTMIMLHVASQNWTHVNVNGFTWQIFNFFDGILRWCVPIFVIIIGNLFLIRQILIKKLYFKYILRLVMLFCFGLVFMHWLILKKKILFLCVRNLLRGIIICGLF